MHFWTGQRLTILYAGKEVIHKHIGGHRAVAENFQKSAGQVSCQGLATEVMQRGLTDDFKPITFAILDLKPITRGRGGTTGRQSPENIF